MARKIFNLVGEITPDMFGRLSRLASSMSKKDTLVLRILSEGGDMYTAIAIISLLRSADCYPSIVTEIHGAAFSGAALIFLAGKTRRMSKNGFFMWHAPIYKVNSSLADHEDEVEQARREWEVMCKIASEVTGQPKDVFAVKKDLYLDPETCLKLGVANELI